MRVVAILFCLVAVAFFVSLALASPPKVSEEFSAIIKVTISEKNGTASQHQNLTGTGTPPFHHSVAKGGTILIPPFSPSPTLRLWASSLKGGKSISALSLAKATASTSFISSALTWYLLATRCCRSPRLAHPFIRTMANLSSPLHPAPRKHTPIYRFARSPVRGV
jgi:hypothetical protein